MGTSDPASIKLREVSDHLSALIVPDESFVRFPSAIDPNEYYGRVGVQLVIPTPDPASTDGQVTHPSVVHVPEGWNGYRYWMAYTPYAGGNDAYEDPCIVASNNGTDWVIPAGLTNPLDDAPGGDKYNSDTCLILDGQTMHLVWRYFDNTAVGAEEHLYVRSSTDGATWTDKAEIYGSHKKVRRIVSPALVLHDGVWHMWGVDIVTEPSRLVHATAPEITGPWTIPETCSLSGVQPGKKPWHVSVRRVGCQYVGLLNDTNAGGAGGRSSDLQIITSLDGVNWEASIKPVIPRAAPGHTDLYAACMVPSGEGFDVWYSARISGSPSVWHIFRTRLVRHLRGMPYAVASGTVAVGAVTSGGGTVAIPVTFPRGLFTKAPEVMLSSSNGRLNTGWAAVTQDGFTASVFNWTTGNTTIATLAWTAVQSEA